MTDLLISEATLRGATHSGVARYMSHIVRAAAGHFGPRAAVASAARMAPAPVRWIPVPRFPGSGRLHVQDVIVTAAAAVLRPRLFFSGYYGSARVAAPQVFTVYDMIHELYVGAMDEKRRCLERATALIAISHNTAADIVRIYPQVDPAKITVTHLGVDDAFFAPRRSAAPERPYFLFVGTRVGSKNFLRLARAFAASGVGESFDLRVVSRSGAFSAEERAAIGDAPVTLQAPLSEDDLIDAYANAHALLYPSEYEGFGLPILEAMAAGTLVAASRAASMPEVGGEAAFYFNPLDEQSIAQSIATMARLPREAREARIAEGLRWARTFTWARCEAQTMALFEKLLSSRSAARDLGGGVPR